MAPLTTTRTLFELRVGSTHTIEVLLQVRLEDLPWWNSDLRSHERQLYKLIGRQVLRMECRKEIEEYRAKIRERDDAEKNIAKKTNKKSDVIIGEANLKKKMSGKEKRGATTTTGRKRVGRKSATTKKETKSSSSKKQKLSESKKSKGGGANNSSNNDETNASETKENRLKLLREPGKWIMGKSIQICYMMEDLEKSYGTTLVFRPKETGGEDSENNSAGTKIITSPNPKKSTEKQQSQSQSSSREVDDGEEKVVPLASFRSWQKLTKRLNLWVFQFDPNDPSDLNVSEGGGFPRPELLPMSDIFR